MNPHDGYLIGQSFVPNTTLLDAAGTPINEDGSGLGGGFKIALDYKQAKIFDGATQSVIPATAPPRSSKLTSLEPSARLPKICLNIAII